MCSEMLTNMPTQLSALCVSRVSSLEHVVSMDGISIEQDKLAAINAWPSPSNPGELKDFLGLANSIGRL